MQGSLTEFQAGRDKITTDYKTACAACAAMRDNATDVCVEEAKGKERSPKGELDQKVKPSDGNARKLAEAKVDATYSIAKEKCDDWKGDAKAVCAKQAKAGEGKGKADINAMTKGFFGIEPLILHTAPRVEKLNRMLPRLPALAQSAKIGLLAVFVSDGRQSRSYAGD